MRALGTAAMLVVILATGVIADDQQSGMDEMRNAIAAWKRSNHLCPSGGEAKPLKYEIYCKQWCDIGATCHGTKSTDPCAVNSNTDECQRFAKASSDCLKDLNAKNSVIVEYTNIIRQCRSKGSSSEPSLQNCLKRAEEKNNEKMGEQSNLRNHVEDWKDEEQLARDRAIAAEAARRAQQEADQRARDRAIALDAARRAAVKQQLINEGNYRPVAQTCSVNPQKYQLCVDRGINQARDNNSDNCDSYGVSGADCERLCRKWYCLG